MRIALYEDQVNAVMAVNDAALAEADRLDAERAAGTVRGPLHGIPIALKDNVHTTDVPTTGGALVFRDYVPPFDATLTTLLREAGAVIIAKTVMTELANFTAHGHARQLQRRRRLRSEPLRPRRDPREGRDDGRPVLGVGGSSSGIGTAMSFWAGNVGTETSGSILSPSNANMLAAVKPTVGRVSRWGVIPITADQDTAGPMARTVTDAAILLGALEGAEPDPNDPATTRCEPPEGGDYTRFLDADALAGARIGVPRALYYDRDRRARRGRDARWPRGRSAGRHGGGHRGAPRRRGDGRRSGRHPVRDRPRPGHQPALPAAQQRARLRHEAGLRRLARFPRRGAPVRTLTELREWNLAHRSMGTLKYEQATPRRRRRDRPRGRSRRLRGGPGAGPRAERRARHRRCPRRVRAGRAAVPGLPRRGHRRAPGLSDGHRALRPRRRGGGSALAGGLRARAAALRRELHGTACSEPELLALAYAFEQATRRREAPPAERVRSPA